MPIFRQCLLPTQNPSSADLTRRFDTDYLFSEYKKEVWKERRMLNTPDLEPTIQPSTEALSSHEGKSIYQPSIVDSPHVLEGLRRQVVQKLQAREEETTPPAVPNDNVSTRIIRLGIQPLNSPRSCPFTVRTGYQRAKAYTIALFARSLMHATQYL